MLQLAIVLLLLSVLFGVVGHGGVALQFAGVAQILFVVFVVLFLLARWRVQRANGRGYEAAHFVSICPAKFGPFRSSMSDEADRIRRQMQNVRQELGDDVKGIVAGARQLSDWRYYVRRHPWICAGSAFALGVLATPARRKVLGDGEMAQVLHQLGTSGLAAAAGRAAPLSGGGIASKMIAIAAPIVARHAAAFVAQRFASDQKSKAEVAPPPDVVAP